MLESLGGSSIDVPEEVVFILSHLNTSYIWGGGSFAFEIGIKSLGIFYHRVFPKGVSILPIIQMVWLLESMVGSTRLISASQEACGRMGVVMVAARLWSS